jgi:hypothetical protein
MALSYSIVLDRDGASQDCVYTIVACDDLSDEEFRLPVDTYLPLVQVGSEDL